MAHVFFFIICVLLHRELSTVKGKQNGVLYHSFPPFVPVSGNRFDVVMGMLKGLTMKIE